MGFLTDSGVERLWTHIVSLVGNKVDRVSGKGLSTNDYTTAEKEKLAGIKEGATKITVDTNLSASSTNPVQNSVIHAAITNLNTLVGDTAVSSQINTAVTGVKNDLLNGAGEAYDTLKELGDLISENVDAIDALEIIAINKADKTELQNIIPKVTTITMTSAGWTGDAVPYSQVVTVSGVTVNSKVDLQPTAAQIVELQNEDIAFTTANNDGVITVYALGSKPTVDYTMQVLIQEVQRV